MLVTSALAFMFVSKTAALVALFVVIVSVVISEALILNSMAVGPPNVMAFTFEASNVKVTSGELVNAEESAFKFIT